MTKKIISLLLALLMTFSLALPSFAVSEENQKLSDEEVQQALNVAVAALVDAPEDATVIVSEELIDEATETADTPAEVSGLLSGFIFIEEGAVDGVATKIAENSKYSVTVIANGKQTVYYIVNLEQHPEIFDARVYRKVIEKIQKKCDEVAMDKGVDITGGNYSPMSYSYIAGELALHIILTKLSKDTASWNPISKWIYNHSYSAEINIDEARAPSGLIEALGDIVVNFIDFILLIFG